MTSSNSLIDFWSRCLSTRLRAKKASLLALALSLSLAGCASARSTNATNNGIGVFGTFAEVLDDMTGCALGIAKVANPAADEKNCVGTDYRTMTNIAIAERNGTFRPNAPTQTPQH